MISQTPSYNPKNRNLEINSEVLQPLEGLDRILHNMAERIIREGEIHNARKAHISTRMINLGEKGLPEFYTYYAEISLFDDKESTVASCKSTGSTLLPGKITCRNLEKEESFEISDDYLPPIRNALNGLSNTIYWEDETRKELARDFGISPYEKTSLTPSRLLKIYANINLTEKQGKPTIEIYENPYCLNIGMLRYKNDRSNIDVHYIFL